MRIRRHQQHRPVAGPVNDPGTTPSDRKFCCPSFLPPPSPPPPPPSAAHLAPRRRPSLPSSSSFSTPPPTSAVTVLFLLAVGVVSLVHGQDSFYFKVKPKNHDVEEGKPVRLRCQVSNNHRIQYRWTLNNEPVQLDTRRIQDGSDLHIRKADAELDSGKFRCVATNISSGYSLQSVAAVINVFWLAPTVSVALTEPSRLENVALGGPLELRCVTSASPPVSPQQIYWYMNFQKLKVKTAGQMGIELGKNGNLRIPKTKTGNVGVYRCLVHHPAGRVMSTTPFPLTFGADEKYNTSNKPEHFIKYVKRGDELKIQCRAFNYSQDRMHFMQWSFRQNLDSEGKTLDITSNTKCTTSRRVCVLPLKDKYALLRRRVRKRSDTGFYKCGAMPWQSKPFVIEVRLATNPRLSPTNLYPPSRPDSPLVVVEGKDMTVRLYQDLTPNTRTSQVPDPPPKYRWFAPGSQVEVPDFSGLSRQRIYKLNKRYLHIKNARPDDTGVYSLWISNLAGDQKINVSVVVAFPPKFSLSRMGNVRAEEDKDTKFRCNVDSMSQYPVARVVWYKDNQRIPDSVRLHEDHKMGTLTIRSVSISDEGTYHCAVNTKKLKPGLHSSESFQLRVIRTLKIINPVQKQFLERNQGARVTCVAQGEGQLRIQWWRNRRVISSMPTGKDIWASKGTLIIPRVTDTYAGNYTCIVSNRQGRVNNTVRVIVGERPTIQSITSNLTVPEGRPVTLNCEATGDPPPTISWIKKWGVGRNSKAESITKDRYARVSPEARRVMLPNGSLLIRRTLLSDAAYYWCVAANTYAMNSEKEVYLRVLPQSTLTKDGRDSSWSMTKTVIIVVGCAVAYLALIIGLTIYCSVRMLRNRQKRAAWLVAKMEGGAPGGVGQENGRLMAMPNGESQGLMSAPDGGPAGPGGPGTGHGDSRSHFSTASAYTRSLRAGTPNGSLAERAATYPRHQLQTLGMLGKGEFGDVFLARAHNIREGESESLVVIKSHHNGRSDALDYEFHQQMDMFAKLDHDFVVKLLGVCREMEPEFMILEYCEWGDLKQFLKAMRQSDKENNERNVKIPPLTASQKVTMCSQVALGMEHLSNYRYVHKDLAARNVLLTSTLDLKIANLGLCQDVYAGEYFPMRNKRLPLRWLPSEVILEDAYSTKSDVWAFGILVYEVFTLGDIPHRRLTDLQVINAAESHFLVPELPAQCPAELASLLRQCWSDKARERPSFNDISVIIGELTVDSDI